MIIDRRAIAWFIGAVATTIVACGPTTTVHVKRGAGLLGLEGEIGQETIRDDGTRVIIVDELPSSTDSTGKNSGAASSKKSAMNRKSSDDIPVYTGAPYSTAGVPAPPPPKKEPAKELQLREVERDGSITLRAVMPEHVMAHFVDAVKSHEYGPFYRQMLADEARTAYDRAGGEEVFVAWAEKNRKELLAFLNRMGSNWSSSEVITERVNALRMRYRLDRRNLPDIRFEVVEITNEHGGVRLALIH